MRYLGIDFGERRIGVAVSDEDATMALPVGVVVRRDDYSAIADLQEMARERAVGALVIGRPTHLDGRPGDLAARACRFGERLARACKLPLHFVDEALTSTEARRQQRDPGRRQADRGSIDVGAARILLQEFIDRKNRP